MGGGGFQGPPVQGFAGPMPGKGGGQGGKGHASVAPMGAQQVSPELSLAWHVCLGRHDPGRRQHDPANAELSLPDPTVRPTRC